MLNLEKKERVLSFAYLAGLFDGEGCIQLLQRKPGRVHEGTWVICVAISQKNKPFLEMLQKEIGYGHIGSWALRFSSRQAQKFLSCVLPYVVLKKKQAELCLEAIHYIRRQYRMSPSLIVEKRLQEIARLIKADHHGKGYL